VSGSRYHRSDAETAGRAGFPVGAAITRTDLEGDPHPLLARLRETEPVSWLPALNGWLVTRRDLAVRVMRDAAAFTVDDPRFSTARVVGPSMLSLDGSQHARHRGPFLPGFSRPVVNTRLGTFAESRAAALVDHMRPDGSGDLRSALAGPLAVAVVAQALGLGDTDPATVLSWYLGIVTAVSALTGQSAPAADGAAVAAVAAGEEAFAALSVKLHGVLADGRHDSLLAQAARTSGTQAASAGGSPSPGHAPVEGEGLTADEVISNAAVLMFGGIETTEGMITNTLLHLLSHTGQLDLVMRDPSLLPNAVEESLRLEPAAAFVDRYATADVRLGGADIRRGELVSVSLAGAGRDPAVFTDPDTFDVRRRDARMHLAFAHGPHFCLGAHLARLEAVAAVRAALTLPGLRLDPDFPSAPRGLVFRKPPALRVRWDQTGRRPGS
jgi:cytochrome P450